VKNDTTHRRELSPEQFHIAERLHSAITSTAFIVRLQLFVGQNDPGEGGHMLVSTNLARWCVALTRPENSIMSSPKSLFQALSITKVFIETRSFIPNNIPRFFPHVFSSMKSINEVTD
jgi:hypothetical protein